MLSLSAIPRLFLSSCYFILFSLAARGQYSGSYFRNLSSVDGLSQNSVSHILQDNQGMIWLATQVGVDKYTSELILPVDGLNKGLTESITLLYDWDDGHILVATDMRNYLVDKWQLTSVQPIDSTLNGILAIHRFGTDSLLVVTDSGMTITNKSLHPLSSTCRIPGARINDAVFGRHGVCFVATDRGLYSYTLFDVAAHALSPLFKIHTLSFTSDSSGLLLGFTANRVLEYRIATDDIGKVYHYRHEMAAEKASPPTVSSLYLERDSLLWIGTNTTGLYLCNLHSGKSQPVYPSFDEEISCIAASKDGVIWVGTAIGGVNLVQRDRQFFQHHFDGGNRTASGDRRPHVYNNNVWSILPLYNDSLLIGTNGNGMALYDSGNDSIVRWVRAAGIKSSGDVVKCLVPWGDAVMIGTEGGLYRWRATGTDAYYRPIFFRKKAVLADTPVSALGLEVGGRYLLAGNKRKKSIEILDAQCKEISILTLPGDGEDVSFFYNVHLSNDSFTLVGSTHTLYRLRPAPWRLEVIGDTRKSIHYICAWQKRNSDTLWLGTDRRGIFCYKLSKTLQLQNLYTRSHGFPLEVIYSIAEDRHGSLWFSTNHGIYEFLPGVGINRYEKGNYSEIPEFNAGSFASLGDSLFFFGGVNGVTSFYPDAGESSPAQRFRPVLRLFTSYARAEFFDFNRPDSETRFSVHLPYKFGFLDIVLMLGYYQNPENTEFVAILNQDTIYSGNDHDYKIYEDKVHFLKTNVLTVAYRTANGQWLTLPPIQIYRRFFTGINVVLIPLAIAAMIILFLIIRYLISWRKLRTVLEKTNDISRLEKLRPLEKLCIRHLLEVFKFHYAVISRIDFDKKIIRSELGDRRGTKVANPEEWKGDSIYPLDHMDILAQTARMAEPVIVINNRSLNPKIIVTDDTFNGKITEKYGHKKLARIFIPIIHRALTTEAPVAGTNVRQLVDGDIVMGVIEVGMATHWLNRILTGIQSSFFRAIARLMASPNLNVLQYLQRETIRLQLYVDNFARPYYEAYSGRQKKINSDLIGQLGVVSHPGGIDPRKFLAACLGHISERIGAEYGSVSLATFNTALIDPMGERIYYSIEDSEAKANIDQFAAENAGKAGTVNTVAWTRDPLHVSDIDKDTDYIKVFPNGRSQMVLPMQLSSKSPLYGVITLISSKPGYFNKVLQDTYAATVQKVTEIYIQQKQYSALREMASPALESFVRTEKDLYQQIVGTLRRYFDSDYINVWDRNSYDKGSFKLSKTSLPAFYDECVRFKLTDFELKKEYAGESLARIAQVDELENRQSSLYRFCTQPALGLRSYIILYVIIDNRYQAFINIFSKRELDKDAIAGHSRIFLEDISKKLSLATQSIRLSTSMELISASLVKRDTESTMQQLADQACRLLPAVDSVVLFPYRKGETIVLKDAAFSGKIPPEDQKNLDRPANIANLIIHMGSQWIESEAQYLDLVRASAPHKADRETFWQKRGLLSVAAIKLEYEGDPLGVMFFNYKLQRQFNVDNTRQLIDAFTNFARVALVNEGYIRRIETAKEQMHAENRELQERQAFLRRLIDNYEEQHKSDLERMQELLPVANAAALVEIVRAVNHDIRNHLFKIEGTIDSIPNKSKLFNSFAKEIQNDIENAGLLIDLFDPDSFKPELCDLDDIAANVATLFRSHLRRRDEGGIEVDTSGLNTTTDIRCSKAILAMIIYNLLSNSEKAIDAKWEKNGRVDAKGNKCAPQGKITITSSYAQHGGFYTVTVHDDGIGIPRDFMPLIFNLDFTTSAKGTGIGLYFVKTTIENLFSGTVVCESRVNLWTKFTLKFRQSNQTQQSIYE